MRNPRFLFAAVSIALCLLSIDSLAQQNQKQQHSWDVLMNLPEAKQEDSQLLGHCGDAKTQDVMNACFAMQFTSADRQLRKVYESILSGLEEEDQSKVRTAQNAWKHYRDAHCATVGALQVGQGSLEPTVILGCKARLTRLRTKEIQADYRTPQ